MALTCAGLPMPLPAAAQDTEDTEAEAPSTDAPDSFWDYLRELLYQRHRRWRRQWRDWRDAQGQTTNRCGDGELQSGEQCDDGNSEPADGCDDHCELEDDATTPGDDRPGFVLCASSEDPALTCNPEQRCCRSPENVCDSLEQDCQREDVTVGWGDNCDGPEDCEANLSCVRGKYGASCTPENPQQGYPVLCHKDANCTFIPEARCATDGTCTKL